MRDAKTVNEREKLLREYRKIDIETLLDTRFNGSYDRSTIEQVILEKVNYLLFELGK